MTDQPKARHTLRADPKKQRTQLFILGGLCVATAGVLAFRALQPNEAPTVTPATNVTATTAVRTPTIGSDAATRTTTTRTPETTTAASSSGTLVHPIARPHPTPARPTAANSTSAEEDEPVADMYQHSSTDPTAPDGPPVAAARQPRPAPAPITSAVQSSAPVQLHAAPLPPTTTQVIPVQAASPVPPAAPVTVRPIAIQPARPVVVPTTPTPRPQVTPVQATPATQPVSPATQATPTTASSTPSLVVITPSSTPALTYDGMVSGAEPVAILTTPTGQVLLSPGDAIGGTDLTLKAATSQAAVLVDAYGHTTTLPLKGQDQ